MTTEEQLKLAKECLWNLWDEIGWLEGEVENNAYTEDIDLSDTPRCKKIRETLVILGVKDLGEVEWD